MVMEPDFNQRAGLLFARRLFAAARALLEAATRDMPARWKPCQHDGSLLKIAFWDREEFLAYVKYHRAGMTKSIAWVPGSYSY
jgi:hypothetical protein